MYKQFSTQKNCSNVNPTEPNERFNVKDLAQTLTNKQNKATVKVLLALIWTYASARNLAENGVCMSGCPQSCASECVVESAHVSNRIGQ